MKNIVFFFFFIISLFSCQHRTEIKRKRSIDQKGTIQNNEFKVDTITEKDLDTAKTKKDKTEKIESAEGKVVLLPNNRYAVVILDYYENKKEEDPMRKWVAFPKKVKVYNRKTKRQVRETRLDDYFEDENDDNYENFIFYGDFNFDGKMDVAVRGEELGYRSFYRWNFYLATSKGYKFSKSFSAIMDNAIAYLKLDPKNKRILAYREAEWYNCSEYKIKNNKAELIKETSTSHNPSPFISHSEIVWKGKKWTETKNYKTLSSDMKDLEKQIILSFDIKKLRKKIMLFVDDSVGESICYVEIKNDSIVEFDAYDILINYKRNKNILEFAYQNRTFKIYEFNEELGAVISDKNKTINLIGDFKSKKGSLKSLSNNREWQNEYWFKNNVVIDDN